MSDPAFDEAIQMINNAKAQADAALGKAVTYTETAQTVAAGQVYPGTSKAVVAPTFAIPAFIPNANLSTLYKTEFDKIWKDMEAWVRSLMNDYVNTYFPILDPAIQTAENAWLLGVVNNGYLGIPVAVETAMWDRARAKDTLEALRLEDEAITQFAARGFSLPPGVLTNRLQVAQQEAANKSSTIARDLAIKQTEISIEMTKFAIGEMTKLRLGIAAALADFMRAWMELPKAAAEVAKAEAEMYRLLWTSSASYVDALTNKARLTLDADMANQRTGVAEETLFVENFQRSLANRTNAAQAAASEMGSVAAAYANTLNTLANVGSVTTTAL